MNSNNFNDKIVLGLATQSDLNATVETASIDTSSHLEATFGFELANYTAGTYAINLEESINNSDWTDVENRFHDPEIPEGETYLAVTTDFADDYFNVGYSGHKRYVRASVTGASATGDITVCNLQHGVKNSAEPTLT